MNGAGVLSPEEARRAPSATLLRRASNSFFNDSSATATLLEMDANRDGKVTLDEAAPLLPPEWRRPLAVFDYRHVGPLRQPDHGAAIPAARHQQGRQLSRAEVQAAAHVLGPLDQNDDELVGVESWSRFSQSVGARCPLLDQLRQRAWVGSGSSSCNRMSDRARWAGCC